MLLARISGSSKWGSYGAGDLAANTDASTSPVIHVVTDNNTSASNVLYMNGTADGTFNANRLVRTVQLVELRAKA